MHGDIANKLVLPPLRRALLPPSTHYIQVHNAKRSLTLPNLPPYQTELVRAVTREIRDLDRDAASIISNYPGSFNPSEDQATACALLVDHLSMRRNKRCLLAYHRTRAERVEGWCWEGRDWEWLSQQNHSSAQGASGGGLSEQQKQRQQMQTEEDGSESSLSPDEQEFFRLYTDFLSSYKGQFTDIDLTGSLDPPRDLFIDVRVLKDAGEIQTEYGVINLTKNSQFFVRHGDVERLIGQGFLQRLS